MSLTPAIRPSSVNSDQGGALSETSNDSTKRRKRRHRDSSAQATYYTVTNTVPQQDPKKKIAQAQPAQLKLLQRKEDTTTTTLTSPTSQDSSKQIQEMTGMIHYLSKSIKALQVQQKDMQATYDTKIQKLEQKCSSLEQHALYSDAKLKKVRSPITKLCS